MHVLTMDEIRSVSGGICPNCMIAGLCYLAFASSAWIGGVTNQYVMMTINGVLLTVGSYFIYQFLMHAEL